jgi:dihydroflavonol-4-reductase
MIFVTGGTGLLGSHLLFQLTSEGKSVRAIYRNFDSISRVQKLFNFYNPKASNQLFKLIEWVVCDVRDVVTLEEVMTDCNQVYHCAAAVSFRKKHFHSMMKINREGTANMVNVALTLPIEKFCFVSSTAAVAKDDTKPDVPLVETNKWIQSEETSGYAISKYSSEKEVWRGIEEGLNAVIINPSVIIGAWSWEESSMTIFKTISNGFKFYTKGANAFVDARDVAKAMFLLMESPISNQRFLCTGTNVSFREVFNLIAAALNQKPPSIQAGMFLSQLARFVDGIQSLFTNKRVLTKESVNSAYSVTSYNSSKLLKAIDFQFTPLGETIENAVKGRIL